MLSKRMRSFRLQIGMNSQIVFKNKYDTQL